MRKFFILVVACALLTNIIRAQEFYPKWGNIAGNTQSRLVFAATWRASANELIPPEDSSYFKYSGNNTWDEQRGNWKYDEFMNALYHDINTYNAQGYLVSTEYKSKQTGQMETIGRNTITYSGTLPSEEVYEMWRSNKWEFTTRKKYTYDGQGRVTNELMGNPNLQQPQLQYKYTYSADGLTSREEGWVSPSGADTGMKREEISYANGKKSEHKYMTFRRSKWQWFTDKHLLYEYDNNGINTSLFVVYMDTLGRNDTSKEVYHYNALGLVDTVNIYTNASHFDTAGWRMVVAYNEFGQPLTVTNWRWDRDINEWVYPDFYTMDKYYYFRFNLGIPEKEQLSAAIKLYPVPTANELKIEMPSGSSKAMQLMIYSMDGKPVRSWTAIPSAGNYTETIDVSGFAAGNYILRAAGEEGQRSQVFSVAK